MKRRGCGSVQVLLMIVTRWVIGHQIVGSNDLLKPLLTEEDDLRIVGLRRPPLKVLPDSETHSPLRNSFKSTTSQSSSPTHYQLLDPSSSHREKPSQWSKWIPTNALKKVLGNRDYRFYYQISSKIQKETQDPQTRLLAQKVQLLGHSPPQQKSFLIRNAFGSQSVLGLFELGINLLEHDQLSIRERVWILGLLSSLEVYFPKGVPKVLEKNIADAPLSRGGLELSLIRDKDLKAVVENLWKNSRNKISDPSLEEVLERVKLFHNMISESQKEPQWRPTRSFINLYDRLLLSGPSLTDDTILELMIKCRGMMEDHSFPESERLKAHSILSHVLNFSSLPHSDLIKFLTRPGSEFYDYSAQKLIRSILVDPNLSPHLRSLILPFENFKTLGHHQIQTSIHALDLHNLNPEEEIYFYRVLSASSACDPRMWLALRSRLKTDSKFRLHVIEIWKKMYPRMNVKSIPRLDSDYLLLSKSKNLLRAARREIILQDPEFDQIPSLQKIKTEMINLPLDPQDGLHQASVVLRNIYQTLTIDSEKELGQKIKLKSFEALCQLLWYHDSLGQQVMDEISLNRLLRSKLNEISSHILTSTSHDPQSYSEQLIFYAEWISQVQRLLRVTDYLAPIIA